MANFLRRGGIAVKSNDFVKYLTVQLVERIDKPREKKEEPMQPVRKSFSTHWFGMIPLSVKMYSKRFNKK